MIQIPVGELNSASLPLQATFLFSLVNWAPLSLGKGLVAPAWATTLGWILTFSSVSLLPIWAIYALATTPGTLPQVPSALKQIIVLNPGRKMQP